MEEIKQKHEEKKTMIEKTEHQHEHVEHSHEHNHEHVEHKTEAQENKNKGTPQSDLIVNDKEQKHPAPKSDKDITKSEVVDNDKVKVDNKEKKKEEKPTITKKDEASANGISLPLSKKHCMYIGTFIKGKPIDLVISQLEEVIKMKRAIAYKGEIPHRHQEGMMSGRYPVKASKAFIPLLKGLKGNAIANGMDIDKLRITTCVPNWASRPSRSGGRRGKRVHILLKAREVIPSEKASKPKQEKSKESKEAKK